MSVTRLEAIWHFSSSHGGLLGRAERCGCFHCQSFFAPGDVLQWVDNHSTALCPHCGIDAVLPEVPLFTLDAALLEEMHRFWFSSAVKL